ncbi:MAG: hypothetical protein ACYDHF_00585 [Candidatus Cryosericum sp.]
MRHSLSRILLELAAGVVFGALFLVAGSWLGATLGKGTSSGWGDIIGALFGSVLACPVGFIGGMWLAALRLHTPHSTWKAAVGAILGIVAVMLLAEPLRLNQDSRVMGALLYLVPSVLALIGFNLPRRDQGCAGC